jgi:hypothetical protein
VEYFADQQHSDAPVDRGGWCSLMQRVSIIRRTAGAVFDSGATAYRNWAFD